MKMLSSQYLYRGRIVNLRLDEIELAQKPVLREVVEHPGAVAILAVDRKENVILIRQYRHPTGRELLEVPAGMLEPGEEPLQCARRELAEETGLGGTSWRSLAVCYTSPGFCTEKLHYFAVTDLVPAPGVPDEDEELEVVRIPLREACRMALAGEIADAKTLIALFLGGPSTA